MDRKYNPLEVLSSPQQEYDLLRHVTAEFPCSYLPGRLARHESFHTDQLDGATYEKLLGRGFRRCGRIVYRPRCRTCHECRQMRIPVRDFAPTRSMRRVLRQGRDIRVETAPAEFSDAKFDLYRRYLDSQHDGSMSRDVDAFRDFLCASPTTSFEFQYFLGDRLIGVSLMDQVPSGLSSVYMYFDPETSSRSPGTLSILHEIQYCVDHKMQYYYLGYLVSGCGKMEYKSRFTPFEILVSEQRWLGFRARSAS